MRLGKLKDKVVIKYHVADQDDIGQPTQTEAVLCTVWADVRFPGGLETVLAGAQTSVTRASVRIRRRTDVTTAMWVMFGAQKLQITAVLPDTETRERLDLACEVVL